MLKPIARVGDAHTCPLTTPNPHVGGPILPMVVPPIVPPTLLSVYAGGQLVAVVGNQCTCAGPPDVIQAGSSSVFIGNRPVARLGDATVHTGGLIASGLASVQVG